MSEVAIRVSNVSKNFRLPHEKTSSIKNLFLHAHSYLRKRRTYETQHALKDVSFEVKKGEFFGIVGRNGSGKSTLLKMLAGIYQPTQGKIEIAGKLVPFIELGVGFSPELTGRENVYLNGALLGFSKVEIDQQYKEIVEFAELEKFMDQKLKNYSSGMQVRLAFSMAIRGKADILLVDEVLAVGDADFQRKCFEYFRELKKQKVTVVFITHDMSSVREYCDRAMLIDQSEVVAIGSTDKITKQYIRMFQEQDEPKDEKKEMQSKRWGNGAVKFESIEVSPKRLKDDNKKLTIKCSLKANIATEDIILGFMIKNSADQAVVGTNTLIKQIKSPNMKKGESISVQWEVDNVFSDGDYWVEPAVVYDGGTTVAEWWEEAESFTVVNDENTPYVVSPNIEVLIER